jgi:hypothetical protein
MITTGRPDVVTLQFDIRMAARFVSEHGPYITPFFCFFYGHKSSQLADFEPVPNLFKLFPIPMGVQPG